jgi:hypothetical protein
MHPNIEDYYWVMAARKRLIAIDGDSAGLCTFFVLQREEEIPAFYNRRCWSTPPDHAEGPIIYFDKLVATHFTRALFRLIERRVTEHHPRWERWVWSRPSPGQQPDRRYIYRRRMNGADVHG